MAPKALCSSLEINKMIARNKCAHKCHPLLVL
jgi:hypothetical protein